MPTPTSPSSPPTSDPPLKPSYEEIDAICAKHGAYRSRVLMTYPGVDMPLRSGCPTCGEERRIADEESRLRQEALHRSFDIRRLSLASGIPARFEVRTFANYCATAPGQKIALASCRAFAVEWPLRLEAGASLVLTGGPGTGKTHLACAIGSHVISEHLGSVFFATVATMLRAIKDTYRKDSPVGEQQAINNLVRPDLLILDEVGVQVGSEHEKMLMFEVLNARYQGNRPSILISNLSSDELEAFLGHRLMDRYRECGSVIAFNWDSYRGKGQ